MNPTPKQTFIKAQELRSALEKFVVSKEAAEARNYALLEFVNQQPTNVSMQESWDQHSQLAGARKILDILFELPFAEAQKTFARMPNLESPK